MNSNNNATAQEKFKAVAAAAFAFAGRIASRRETELGSCGGVRPATAEPPQAQLAGRKPMRHAFPWLLGIPIPVLILLWFFHVL
jgi:hypothetical protein